MAEIADLIGIYGAIDRAVVRDPNRRSAVSQLLPLYRQPGVQWFEEFEEWTRELRADEPRGQLFPSLETALKGLATVEPSGRMRARRLFVIAVATRAEPRLRNPRSKLCRLARAALRVNGLASDEDQAQRLLDLLGNEELLPPIEGQAPGALDEWWTNLLETASKEGLIGEPALFGPRPCSGRLVEVEMPDGSGPVATLVAGFETDAIKFERAIRFLEPSNWPDCSDFWCEMEKVGVQPSGAHHYHEVVSTDCDHQWAAWTISAELDFTFRTIPGVAAFADYQLSEGHPKSDDDVLVDEGGLIVQRIGAGPPHRLRVETSKRVRFNHPFSGEQLALMMCALGYASIVEDFVFTCAALPEKEKGKGTSFPGKTPTAPGTGPRFDCGPMINVLASRAAGTVKVCLAGKQQPATKGSSTKAGSATAGSPLADMASSSARMLRDSATVLDHGIRSAQRTTRPRTDKSTEN
ncbi:MAG TPA: hypothetical protein VHJ37_05995 [Thermoleophilaceae bacterium]|jgi:hypothetical protein|nr:hypothetical protein [Thermoleophilaceae bacterium]